jgi:hypothetical protein
MRTENFATHLILFHLKNAIYPHEQDFHLLKIAKCPRQQDLYLIKIAKCPQQHVIIFKKLHLSSPACFSSSKNYVCPGQYVFHL